MVIPPNYANTLRSFFPNSISDVESYAVFRNSTFNTALEISGENLWLPRCVSMKGMLILQNQVAVVLVIYKDWILWTSDIDLEDSFHAKQIFWVRLWKPDNWSCRTQQKCQTYAPNTKLHLFYSNYGPSIPSAISTVESHANGAIRTSFCCKELLDSLFATL